jgi:hypothetical protein
MILYIFGTFPPLLCYYIVEHLFDEEVPFSQTVENHLSILRKKLKI